MEKKIRTTFVALIVLSLLVPFNESWPVTIVYYLVGSPLFLATGVIPIITSLPHSFALTGSFSSGGVFENIWWFVSNALGPIAFIFWSTAIPLLLLWNLYLTRPRSGILKSIYRIWLFVSFISIVYVHIYRPQSHGFSWYEMGIWFILILPGIAVLIEIYLWFVRRGRAQPLTEV